MAKPKNTGLGRGLDAIFKDNFSLEEEKVSTLRVSEIEPRADQPRKVFDPEALAGLAESITEHGLLQPLIVRKTDFGTYEIVAGERRWRAAKMAGLLEVPVILMDIDNKTASEIAIIENIQRENLNPVEEAKAYKSLIDEYGLTQEELSKRLSKSRSAIANSMRLVDLPEEVLEMLENGKMTAGHARTLLGLKNKQHLLPAAKDIVTKRLSVRETEQLVKKLNSAKRQTSEEYADSHIKVDYSAELSSKLTKKLGRRVKIINKGKSKKIEIEFSNDNDLNEIAEMLFGKEIFDD